MHALDDEFSEIRRIINQDKASELAERIAAERSLLTATTSAKKQSILHLAVSNGSLEIVRLLSRLEGDNISFRQHTNAWGESALQLAAAAGDGPMLTALMACNIDQSLQDQYNRTAVDVALQMGHLHLIGAGLLSRAFATSASEPIANTVVHDEAGGAAKACLAQELSDVLLRKEGAWGRPTVTKVRGIFQDPVTVSPSAEHQPATVTAFRATMNTSMPSSRVSLSKMVEFPGDPEQLAVMLHPAEGPTSCDINGKDMFGLTALHKFSAWDKLDLMDMLLNHPEVNINAVGPMGSALHSAVDMAAEAAVRRLLMTAIDRNIVDKEGRTALDLAKIKGLQAVVSLFESFAFHAL